MIKTIYSDMDGVKFNFVQGVIDAMQLDIQHDDWVTYDGVGISSESMWTAIDDDPEFWQNLQPYPWFDEYVGLLSRLSADICVCTDPGHDARSCEGKQESLYGTSIEHWPRIFCQRGHGENNVTHKWRLANFRSLLIDDNDQNVEDFRNAGGNAILFPQPWNKNKGRIGDRMQYLRDELRYYFPEMRKPTPLSRTKVVLFNGPPLSGKDTLADMMHAKCIRRGILSARQEFKTKIYEAMSLFYGIPLKEIITLCTDRRTKTTPQECFKGKTPREALIHTSEVIIKPNLGEQWFGVQSAEALQEGACTWFSDSGFPEETMPIVQAVGRENVLCFRLHRGTTYKGDSRNYLSDDIVQCVDIHSEHESPEDTIEKIEEHLGDFLPGYDAELVTVATVPQNA